MALADQYNLATLVAFVQRVQASLVAYCVNTVAAEVANDVQTVSVSGAPTGGSFTLANGPLTAAVAPAWNATAQALQSALAAALASGNSCVCTGGPLPATPIAVTWQGGLANSPQNVMGVTANNLTGGASPVPTVAHTTVGVAALYHASRAALSKLILATPDSYAADFAFTVAANAAVQTAYLVNHLQTDVTDAQVNAAVAAAFNLYI